MVDTGIRIDLLPGATALTGVEVFPVVQDDDTRQATIDQVRTYVYSDGGSIEVTAAGSTAARVHADRFADIPNVLDWDGTDFEDRLIAAIAAAPDDERTVLRVNPGLYTITEPITIDKPVLLDCRGRGSLDTSANSTISGVRFTWGGSAGGYMFTFSGSSAANMILGTTTGLYLKGGGMIGAAVNGNHSAVVAIWAASTQEMEFEVNVSRCTTYGLILDGGNGALSSFNRVNLFGIWGAQAGAVGMTGVFVRSFNSFPSTQNEIWSAFSYSTGWGVVLGETDNNRLHRVSGLWFRDDDGVGPARNNHVVELVGKVRQDADCFGNTIAKYTSEGASIVDLATLPQKLHILSFLDYISTGGEAWRSPAYKLHGSLPLVASSMRADGAVAAVGVSQSLWDCIRFPDSGTGTATFSVPAQGEWSDGWLIGLKICYSTGSANTAATMRLRVRGVVGTDGAAFVTPTLDDSFTILVNNTAQRIAVTTMTFTTPISVPFGSMAFFILSRVAGDAADVVTGDVDLFYASPVYLGEGPDTSGSGPLLLKTQVATVATTNVTLSGEQTIDGVLTSASRVLAMGQTLPAQNGIYVSAAGAWTRGTDMDVSAEFIHAVVRAGGGTVNSGKYFICTNPSALTVGTTAVEFVEIRYPS